MLVFSFERLVVSLVINPGSYSTILVARICLRQRKESDRLLASVKSPEMGCHRMPQVKKCFYLKSLRSLTSINFPAK